MHRYNPTIHEKGEDVFAIMYENLDGDYCKYSDAESAIAAAVAAERERCAAICVRMALRSGMVCLLSEVADEIRKGTT